VGDTKGLHVLHWCDRPVCCHPLHLHLGTQQTNMAERSARNRQPRGERHGIAKLTAEDVLMIRSSPLSSKTLAGQLGVHYMTVRAARAGRTWGHL